MTRSIQHSITGCETRLTISTGDDLNQLIKSAVTQVSAMNVVYYYYITDAVNFPAYLGHVCFPTSVVINLSLLLLQFRPKQICHHVTVTQLLVLTVFFIHFFYACFVSSKRKCRETCHTFMYTHSPQNIDPEFVSDLNGIGR